MRGLPYLHRRHHLLQHHPDRPRRHRHHAGRRDEGRRRQHLGRRQHLQGQRHRALLPLRPADQPGPADLQAVAGPAVHRRTGRPRRDVRVHAPERLRLQDVGRKGVFDRLQHAGRHPRGQGPGAPGFGHPHRPADHGRAVLARRRRSQARGSHGAFRGRPAGRAERPDLRQRRRPVHGSQPHRRPPWPGHERPDREPHHRGQEPRHLRSPGPGAAVHRLRAPDHRHPQRRHHRAVPRQRPPPGPPAVPGPLVRPAGHHAARNRPALGRRRHHRRSHHRTAPRQRLLDPEHHFAQPDLQAGTADHGKGRVDVHAAGPHRPADHAHAGYRRHAREAADVCQDRPAVDAGQRFAAEAGRLSFALPRLTAGAARNRHLRVPVFFVSAFSPPVT
ncbi:hypothetical protein CBM2599_B50222 [Cupriavidus taiwanensis]|nr:hypothetical protein CBM2600_B10765 [Cupriavidus taiwanensis]SOY96290.1 hypothetical protein CBM2599_B50222 [Cupriavidus taiwanensis]